MRLLTLSPPVTAHSAPDPLTVSVHLDDELLFASRGAAVRVGGSWAAPHLLSTPSAAQGTDRLGKFNSSSATYSAAGTTVVLSVRQYADAIAFEQHFPHGLAAGSAGTTSPPQPAAAFPSLSLAEGLAPAAAWRSWHGHWGSFTGVGLQPNNSLIFNGVPTMPLLFFGNRSGGSAVMVSPLGNFTDAAHATSGDAWRHGPNGRLTALPVGYAHTTLLVGGDGPTATIAAWGRRLRSFHRTNRSAARAADVTLNKIGVFTDNGAYLNFNKVAGNANRPLPRGATAEEPLRRTLASLAESGVRVGYLQLDDWWYEGAVYEGAVSCASDWKPRADWFPSGLRALGVPLMLYLPYLCNDSQLHYPATSFAVDDVVRTGGVPGAPPGAACPWPNVSASASRRDGACNGSYAQPVPSEARAFFRSLFERARAEHGMVAFEQDFVADNSLRYGWPERLGASAEWLDGLTGAAADTRTPVQLCLAVASELMASLTSPWVTQARASADYALCQDSWDLGYAALLHWALDLAPSKDTLWTTPRQPTSPYDNTSLFPQQYARCRDAVTGGHVQRDATGLDALVAAFSTGPVGLGDGPGYTDAALALATCRADGMLLQPDKPLTALDQTFWPDAQQAPPSDGRLLGSHATVGGLSAATWLYVLAVDTPGGAAVVPAALPGAPTATSSRFAVWRWGADDARVSFVDAAAPLRVESAPRHANGTHAWSLYTLAPVLEGGWALLGERGKFVGASSRRLGGVSVTTAGALLVTVRGSAGEVVPLAVAHGGGRTLLESGEGDVPVRTVRVTLPTRGVATVTVEPEGESESQQTT